MRYGEGFIILTSLNSIYPTYENELGKMLFERGICEHGCEETHGSKEKHEHLNGIV